jgi:hypothetical protein
LLYAFGFNSVFMATTTTGYLGHLAQAVPLDLVTRACRAALHDHGILSAHAADRIPTNVSPCRATVRGATVNGSVTGEECFLGPRSRSGTRWSRALHGQKGLPAGSVGTPPGPPLRQSCYTDLAMSSSVTHRATLAG